MTLYLFVMSALKNKTRKDLRFLTRVYDYAPDVRQSFQFVPLPPVETKVVGNVG